MRKAPIRIVVVSRCGIRAAGALITPALFSQPPPRPPGEEGERQSPFSVCLLRNCFFIPLLSRRLGGRLGEKGVGGYEGQRREERKAKEPGEPGKAPIR